MMDVFIFDKIRVDNHASENHRLSTTTLRATKAHVLKNRIVASSP